MGMKFEWEVDVEGSVDMMTCREVGDGGMIIDKL